MPGTDCGIVAAIPHYRKVAVRCFSSLRQSLTFGVHDCRDIEAPAMTAALESDTTEPAKPGATIFQDSKHL
jgi:hypothetical protein